MKIIKQTSERSIKHYKRSIFYSNWNGIINFTEQYLSSQREEPVAVCRGSLSQRNLSQSLLKFHKKIGNSNVDLVTITTGIDIRYESYCKILQSLQVKETRVKILVSVKDKIELTWLEYLTDLEEENRAIVET